MTDTLTLIRPDDWHLHLRDGAALRHTVADAARYFGRAIVMPNLTPPVTRLEGALAYRERIMAQRPDGSDWQPLMVLYLTDNTSPGDIREAHASGMVTAAKLYPAGATTNSASGVTSLERIYPALEAMAETGMPLLVHGEVTHDSIDIFDREAAFIDQQLAPLRVRYPQLRIVFEHITTADAAQFVLSAESNVGATITPQHLMYNRNHLLVGGIKPHFYCLPVLKRNRHQQALRDVVTRGDSRFFLGTDSAPHAQSAKESSCGCAGCYSAHAAIELYAEVFEELGVLDKLEAFASFNGPDFYRLPRNSDRITLSRQPWQVPQVLELGEQPLVPLKAGETVRWKVTAGSFA
ncbi:dihydroorotase [Aestuariirhabdus litorea]|uniref:Dihydroorotase n=1 Tax=Aestuariirhabdus litorea TaxID=2528527 RepID=A0A3P3VN07_9GAMM|nr:dihydroorotase [Aestuariirhabdus litorea]RRJ84142.1 dihydroorotase [Aestuariirhabdus litorea]RWW97362.1 dihydroorotase [Endozoicomonadaceae bacterium GTF-13]